MEGVRTFSERVERLSPDKRSELLHRLRNLQTPAFPRADQEGSASLVAYVTLKEDKPHSSEVDRELLQMCDAELPPHQRPAEIVLIDRMPTLPNGKIDRRGLQDMAAQISRNGSTHVEATVQSEAPRHELDELLLSIWRDVLGIDDVRITDNFFELGGDSIVSIQITSRLRQHGYTIPPTALTAHPTVAELSDELLTDRDSEVKDGFGDTEREFDPLVLLKAGGSEPPLLCLHTSGGDPIIYSEFARQFPSSRPVYGVRSTAVSGLAPMYSMTEMAKYYAERIVEIAPSGTPLHLFTECVGGPLLLEVAHQLDLMGERVGSMMILDPGWIHPERSDWYKPNTSAAEPNRLLRFLRKPDKARKIYYFVRERYRKLTSKRRHRKFIEDLSDYHRLAVEAFTAAAQDYAPAQSPCGIDLLLTADWEFGNVSWPDRLARWKKVATDRITIHAVPGRHAHSFENETAVEVGHVVERILRNAE